jgi:hypothetical protein
LKDRNLNKKIIIRENIRLQDIRNTVEKIAHSAAASASTSSETNTDNKSIVSGLFHPR